MPGSACLVTNAPKMTGDLPEAADDLSDSVPTKIA